MSIFKFSAWTPFNEQTQYSVDNSRLLEMKTTATIQGDAIVPYFQFTTGNDEHIDLQCSDTSTNKWIYVLTACMRDVWVQDRVLTNVPSEEPKVWTFIRRSANFEIVINGVTVLNFRYETDYQDGYSGCHAAWQRDFQSFRLSASSSYHSYVFSRVTG